MPLSSVRVDDPKLTNVVCTPTTLAPGAVANCTADPYVVTAADEAAGTVVNTATAHGTPPAGPGVPAEVTDTDTTTTPIDTPSIALDKQVASIEDVNDSGLVDAGDEITYTFTVTNTGNVTLDPVQVNDPLVGAVTCSPNALAPTESVTCTAAPYVIQPGDQGGTVVNTATATGTPPRGPDVSATDSTTTTVQTPGPAIQIDKSVAGIADTNGSGLTDAGDEITYTFTVTNTGNVPLSQVEVDDPLLGADAVTCTPTSLAPGGVATCTADPYTIKQSDQGTTLVNTATATGTPPAGPGVPPEVTDTDTTSTPISTPAPSIELQKSVAGIDDVDGSGVTDTGDLITYSFTVTNTGNVPLSSVRVDDPKLDNVVCTPTTLAPGATATCTADPYEVTAADETAGTVVNTATAHGTPPTGPGVPNDVTDDDTTTTDVDTPSISLVKQVASIDDVNDSGLVDAGDEVTYTFTVTNTGNVTLDPVQVDDPMLGTVTCSPNALAPTESVTCTAAPYTIKQSDQGTNLVNTATVTGTPPRGPDVKDSSSTSTPVSTPAPSVQLDKSVVGIDDVNGSGFTDAGDLITYSFTVTNTGNVPLSQVEVDDPKLDNVVCTPTTLAPGAVANCTADPYEVTAADETAGTVVNTATAHGTPPTGPGVPTEVTDTDTETTEIDTPSIALDKQVAGVDDTNGSGLVDAGDQIRYTFTVTNTGNVTLDPVRVTDPLLGAVTCAPTALAPTESATCTAAPYTITAADEGGTVVNTATATGTPPRGPDVSSTDSTTTTVGTPAPAIELVKSVANIEDTNDSGLVDAGDEITYAFTVTNTGNVPVRGVDVVDPMLEAAGIAITCSPTTLAPGEKATCTVDGPYVITAADVRAGEVVNVAHATGEDIDGEPVTSADDSATVATDDAPPGIALVKRATLLDKDGDEKADAGEKIRYTFKVTNTGGVKLTGIEIDDPMLDAAGVTITCKKTTLAPGESTTCRAVYTVTAADVRDDKGIRNVATASGDSVVGTQVDSDESTVIVPVDEADSGGPNGPGPEGPDGPDGWLPNTGGPALALLLLGLLLTAGGALLLIRRRRQA